MILQWTYTSVNIFKTIGAQISESLGNKLHLGELWACPSEEHLKHYYKSQRFCGHQAWWCQTRLCENTIPCSVHWVSWVCKSLSHRSTCLYEPALAWRLRNWVCTLPGPSALWADMEPPVWGQVRAEACLARASLRAPEGTWNLLQQLFAAIPARWREASGQVGILYGFYRFYRHHSSTDFVFNGPYSRD